MFIPGSLKELVPMSDVERLRMIRVFSDLGGYVWLSYLALIPTVLALLIVRRHGLRWRGWEFMSYSLFFLALPFEIFQVRYDWRLYELFHFYSTSPSVSPVVNLFQERFIRTAGFSTGTLFAYFTVILLLVWRPLNNRQTNHE